MKEAMLQAYNEGLFDILDIALTVHDELDGSFTPDEKGIKALWRLKEIMQECVQLKVPIKSDLEIGWNWADVHEVSTYEELEEQVNGLLNL